MFSTNCAKWVYRIDDHYWWESGWTIDCDRYFTDSRGEVRLIIEKGGKVTVTSGYAWNGCTPKFSLFDLSFGTPDGAVYIPTGRPKAYYASLVHDALYQFLGENSPISRREADDAFLRLLGESKFRLRWLYWTAVRLGGRLAWKATAVTRAWDGKGTTV
ncbi:MAG: DUF1353 domain-containing protein [Actinomycetota bacterium]|nr:DUF1353 domain-containing protein [Actinomycetota bacterium]